MVTQIAATAPGMVALEKKGKKEWEVVTAELTVTCDNREI